MTVQIICKSDSKGQCIKLMYHYSHLFTQFFVYCRPTNIATPGIYNPEFSALDFDVQTTLTCYDTFGLSEM